MRVPHQNLTESFPELKEAFHHLKTSDTHFQHVLQQYEALDNEINRIDNGGDAIDQLRFETIKKQRHTKKLDLLSSLNRNVTCN